ncbi:MAG: hypothetical protein KDC48_20205, partial [Planctomycetes bacterium]|nr:hypothetical protein [Planctomycetota bacterium]
GREQDEDLIDDGWTHHYAAVQHPPRRPDMTIEEYLRGGEEVDFAIMEEHRRRVEALVHDPDTAASLKPWYRYLCKRPCFHDEFLSAFNEPNVTLVDCPAGFDRIAPEGPVVDGTPYPVDLLVLGTGFEPELTPLYRRAGHDIVGRGGVTLADKWADGPRTNLGVQFAGFPNFFATMGPHHPATFCNITRCAETTVDWIVDCIDYIRAHGYTSIQPTPEAEEAWTRHCYDSSKGLIIDEMRDSWFFGNNNPENKGVPRFLLWAGSVSEFHQVYRDVAAAGYRGFEFR